MTNDKTVLIILADVCIEVASLLSTSLAELDMMMEMETTDETISYRKGYSAALHDTVAILERAAKKVNELYGD